MKCGCKQVRKGCREIFSSGIPQFYAVVLTMWCLFMLTLSPSCAVAGPSAVSGQQETGEGDISSGLENDQCTYADEQVCRYHNIIVMAARHNEVEPLLVMAIIQAESRYDPKAVSRSGARGLMQLMPQTAEAWGVTDSFDPRQNVEGGVRYLKWLLKLFDGDRELALAAYNAGLKQVYRYGGVPPFPATRKYLQLVRQWYEHFKSLEQDTTVAEINAPRQ